MPDEQLPSAAEPNFDLEGILIRRGEVAIRTAEKRRLEASVSTTAKHGYFPVPDVPHTGMQETFSIFSNVAAT